MTYSLIRNFGIKIFFIFIQPVLLQFPIPWHMRFLIRFSDYHLYGYFPFLFLYMANIYTVNHII